ncbi:hypothetical protein L3Y34_016591 [Caenorhabditis briggsae]|uniref:F-box domain-containing protein n=1 Tax=Caenorhabditis briggsae TaxID=6238 RepID=A0AAE9DYP3_CAEBR|nr:hypothetical protein L3Y34_016591 [Caenorhabditis briggsae]
MPISLLKFPTDLLRDVLKQCNPFELYCLSKCSKRVCNSVKLGGEMNWKITYCSREDIMICGDGLTYVFKPTENPEDYFKTIQRTNKYMNMKIPMESVVDMFFYLLDTFAIRIVEWLVIHFSDFEYFSKVATVLMKRNMEIERLLIRYMRDVEDIANFMPLICQMRITKEFKCVLKFPPDFHYQLVKYPSYIHITYAFGFNISQLLGCTCAQIELRNSMLSNQDLNVFFQEWKKSGAFPNLQWLEIESKNIDNRSTILDMVPPITNRENPRKQISVVFGEEIEDEVMIYDAVRICKEDGKKAWLKVVLGDVPKLRFLMCKPGNTWVEEIDLSDYEEESEDEV